MVNYETVLGLTIFLCLGYYLQSGPKIGDFLPQSKVDQFVEDGIVIVDNLFTEEELETISSELMRRVSERPDDVRAEDLLNLHFNDSFILKLASHPNTLSVATQLLDYPRLRLFTTRILCKLPGQSLEIPWHQDSAYWPLFPLKAVSIWLALDDVSEENGAMDMFKFSDMPQSRARNIGVEKVEETGADFFIKIKPESLPLERAIKMELRRGQAEFHDAFVLHHSPENNSNRKRCAWIARYIPDYVHIPKGSWRKMFHDDYPLIRLN